MKQVTLSLSTPDDIPEVIQFCQEFFPQIPHSCLKFDPQKVEQLLLGLLEKKNQSEVLILIARIDGAIIGVLGATAQEPLFSSDRIVTELLLWLKPGYSNITKRFLKAYEYWSLHIAKGKVVHISHYGENKRVEKFFKGLGYKVLETSYYKELK